MTEPTQAMEKVETQSQEIVVSDGFDQQFLAELNADIESTLKQLSVDKLTAAGLLKGQKLTLNDAFTYEMTIDGESQLKVVFVVSDAKGQIYFVAQNPNSNRDRFVTLYDKVRTANAAQGANKALSLTNVSFVELEKGGKAGNKPIVLSFSPETKQVWYDSK